MYNDKSFFAALVLGALSTVAASAGDFKLIGNASVSASSVSIDELRSVFLETKADLGSGHVVPVLEKSGPAHEAFLKDLGKSDSALTTYYRSLVFTGRGSIPKAFSSDAEVVEFVAKTKGAIGYVGAATAAANVKTIDVK